MRKARASSAEGLHPAAELIKGTVKSLIRQLPEREQRPKIAIGDKFQSNRPGLIAEPGEGPAGGLLQAAGLEHEERVPVHAAECGQPDQRVPAEGVRAQVITRLQGQASQGGRARAGQGKRVPDPPQERALGPLAQSLTVGRAAGREGGGVQAHCNPGQSSAGKASRSESATCSSRTRLKG
jgi:hypothetical protein